MKPFFYILPKVHSVTRYNIIQPTSAEASLLKALLWTGRNDEYQKMLQDYHHEGKNFVVTENGVEEIGEGGNKISIQIAVQVKKYTITWYFKTEDEHQDLYSQEWRDKLFDTAGECHLHVDRGCGLYYRGSNAWHLKTMHTGEHEAHLNHNHYRMALNQAVRPEDFAQHMQAFKQGKHDGVREEFFASAGVSAAEEIDGICEKFKRFYTEWTLKAGSGLSPAEEYYSDPSQQLTAEDLLEFRLFGAQQEPCRLETAELTVDYERARKRIEDELAALKPTESSAGVAAPTSASIDESIAKLMAEKSKIKMEYDALLAFREKGGSRGLGADRAESRQLPDSKLHSETLWETVGSHDAPPIPEWATELLRKVTEGMRTAYGIEPAKVRELSKSELASAGVSLKPTANPAPSPVADEPVSVGRNPSGLFAAPRSMDSEPPDVKPSEENDSTAGPDVSKPKV